MDARAPSLVVELLTKREVEVLLLICDGKSSKEIAWNLGITFTTAVCHRARMMEKLDIHELASLVRYAIRKGYLVA